MENFEFLSPTRVVFGRGTEERAGQLAKEYGATKVLVHFGGQSAEKSGLLQRVCDSLTGAGIPWVKLGGVKPNPQLAMVLEGAELCRKEGVDFLLPVGGGSVIDSAKAIGYALADPEQGEVWDFFTGKRVPQKGFPLGCVVTLAAAGSELSNSTVITNEKTDEKRGYRNNLCRPVFAVMNPELTYTVPAYHTAAGVADVLMHTLERYFTPVPDTMELTDGIAEALMRNVLHNGHVLMRDGMDYDARAQVMWAGALSHNDLTGLGNGYGDWACHQLSHELSSRYGLAHGAALTAVWGSWARYVCDAAPERFARFAHNVMELPQEGDEAALAAAGIDELEEFFWAIEMPTCLEEAEIFPTEEEYLAMAKGASRGGARTIGGVKKLDEDDMVAILKMAAKSKE